MTMAQRERLEQAVTLVRCHWTTEVACRHMRRLVQELMDEEAMFGNQARADAEAKANLRETVVALIHENLALTQATRPGPNPFAPSPQPPPGPTPTPSRPPP